MSDIKDIQPRSLRERLKRLTVSERGHKMYADHQKDAHLPRVYFDTSGLDQSRLQGHNTGRRTFMACFKMKSLERFPWFCEDDSAVASRTRKRKRTATDDLYTVAPKDGPASGNDPTWSRAIPAHDLSLSSKVPHLNRDVVQVSDVQHFPATKESNSAPMGDCLSNPTHTVNPECSAQQSISAIPVSATSHKPGRSVAVQTERRSLRNSKEGLGKTGLADAAEGLTESHSTKGRSAKKHRPKPGDEDSMHSATTSELSPRLSASTRPLPSGMSIEPFSATTLNSADAHQTQHHGDTTTIVRSLHPPNRGYKSPYSHDIPQPASLAHLTTIAIPNTNTVVGKYDLQARASPHKRRSSKISLDDSECSPSHGEYKDQSSANRPSTRSGKRKTPTTPKKESKASVGSSRKIDAGRDATIGRWTSGNAGYEIAEREYHDEHALGKEDGGTEHQSEVSGPVHACRQSHAEQDSQEADAIDDAVSHSDDGHLPGAKFRLEVYLRNVAGFLFLAQDSNVIQFTATAIVEQGCDLTIPLVAMCQAPILVDLGSDNMEVHLSTLDTAGERVTHQFRFAYTNKALNAANRWRTNLLDSLLALQTSGVDCALDEAHPILPDKEKSFHCGLCGGRWKNLEGIRYHVTKAKVSCNPDYVPMKKVVSILSHAHKQDGAEKMLCDDVSENTNEPADLVPLNIGAAQSSSSSPKARKTMMTSRGRITKVPKSFQLEFDIEDGPDERSGFKGKTRQVNQRGKRSQKSGTLPGKAPDDDVEGKLDEKQPDCHVIIPSFISPVVGKHKPSSKKKLVSSDKSTWQNAVIILQRKDGPWSQNAMQFYTGRRSKGPKWPDNPLLGPVTFMQSSCDSTWSLKQAIPCVELRSDVQPRKRRKRPDKPFLASASFLQNGRDSTWSLEQAAPDVRLHNGVHVKRIAGKIQPARTKLERSTGSLSDGIQGPPKLSLAQTSELAHGGDRETFMHQSTFFRRNSQGAKSLLNPDREVLTARGTAPPDYPTDTRQPLSGDHPHVPTDRSTSYVGGRLEQHPSGYDAADLVKSVDLGLSGQPVAFSKSGNTSTDGVRPDIGGMPRARRLFKDRPDSRTTVDGRSFNIQKARYATAIPADVELIPGQLVESVNVAEISTNPDQLAKRGKRSLLAFMSQEEELRLVIAVYLIRTLTGGLDKTIDWVLVETVFPAHAMTFCKQSWALAVQTHSTVLKSFARNFDDVFLEAYASGEVAPIDYDSLATYNWGELVNWAMTRLDLTNYGPPEGLPNSREALNLTHGFHELRDSDWRDEYFDPIKPVHRRIDAATGLPFTTQVEDALHSEIIMESSVVKSWIRASIATPWENFQETVVNSKLSSIPKDLLDEAFSALLRERVIVHKNRGRPMPGRAYELGEPVYSALRKHLTEEHFFQACSMKSELDRMFSRREEYQVVWTSNEGEVLALVNMQATGRVDLVMHDLPAHELGLLDAEHQYQTKMMDKKKLRFRIGVVPTAAYLYDVNHPQLKVMFDGNHNPPLQVQGALPLWVDINGTIIWSLWKSSAIAVLCVIAQRPGSQLAEIKRLTSPALADWEVRVLLDWLLGVGAIVCLDKVQEGWNAGEWWWLIAGKL